MVKKNLKKTTVLNKKTRIQKISLSVAILGFVILIAILWGLGAGFIRHGLSIFYIVSLVVGSLLASCGTCGYLAGGYKYKWISVFILAGTILFSVGFFLIGIFVAFAQQYHF